MSLWLNNFIYFFALFSCAIYAILADVDEFENLQMRLELLENIYKAETQINEGRGISHEVAKSMVIKSIKV